LLNYLSSNVHNVIYLIFFISFINCYNRNNSYFIHFVIDYHLLSVVTKKKYFTENYFTGILRDCGWNNNWIISYFKNRFESSRFHYDLC